jgi:hypothetical protein
MQQPNGLKMLSKGPYLLGQWIAALHLAMFGCQSRRSVPSQQLSTLPLRSKLICTTSHFERKFRCTNLPAMATVRVQVLCMDQLPLPFTWAMRDHVCRIGSGSRYER